MCFLHDYLKLNISKAEPITFAQPIPPMVMKAVKIWSPVKAVKIWSLKSHLLLSDLLKILSKVHL